MNVVNHSNNNSSVSIHNYRITPTADFSQEDLEKFLSMLLEKQGEILAKSKERLNSGDMVLDKNEMADEVDLASVSVEQNVTFKLLDRDRALLGRIKRAIEKIASGDYGYCEGTGEVIPQKRLELTPWTLYSVRYQEQLEKSGTPGKRTSVI